MARIFISYKRADKDAVLPLKQRIETALGEPCWIDLDGIESDAQFISVIIRAINEAEVFLFMYSARHAAITDFDKDWTIREINLAEKKGKRIVFVNLDRTPLTDYFELLFGFKQQVDATSEDSFERLLSDLCKWLKINRLEQSKAATKQASKPVSKSTKLNPKNDLNDRTAFDVFHALFPENEFTYAWLATNGVTIKYPATRPQRGIVTLENCTLRPDGSITCNMYLLTMAKQTSILEERNIPYKPCWTGAPSMNGITFDRALEILHDLKPTMLSK